MHTLCLEKHINIVKIQIGSIQGFKTNKYHEHFFIYRIHF